MSAIPDALYIPNLPETSNVRFAINQITIAAPPAAVFKYVTTWSNLPTWLRGTESTHVLRGTEGAPAQMGDLLHVSLRDKSLATNVYTVVAHIPHTLFTISGVDEGEDPPYVRQTVSFITSPVGSKGDQTLFIRLFQDVRKESETADSNRHVMMQPQAIQPAGETQGSPEGTAKR